MLLVLLASAANAFLLAPSYSDLRPVWNGTRAFLFAQTSPYADSVNRQNSEEFHAATKDHPEYDLRFAYPPQSMLLFTPFAILPFQWARCAMTIVCILLTLASVLWWTGTFSWPFALGVLAIYPVMLGIQIQQPTVLFAALLGLAVYAMRTDQPAFAGVLLAMATGKPQLLTCLLPAVVFWVANDWQKRKRLVSAFLAGTVALLAACFALLPGWPAQWVHAMRAYSTYAGKSLPTVALGHVLGAAVSGAVLLLALVPCWRMRHRFDQVLILSVSSILLVLPEQPYNDLLLIAPAWFLLQRPDSRQRPMFILARAAIVVTLAAVVPLTVLELFFPRAKYAFQMLFGGAGRVILVAIYLSIVSVGLQEWKSYTDPAPGATAEIVAEET
jgi:hypothetical protein